MFTSILALGYAALAVAHDGHHDQKAISSGPHESLWYHNALPGDGGTQVSFILGMVPVRLEERGSDQISQADSVFSGISTFGRLPYQPCLSYTGARYDIAFIG